MNEKKETNVEHEKQSNIEAFSIINTFNYLIVACIFTEDKKTHLFHTQSVITPIKIKHKIPLYQPMNVHSQACFNQQVSVHLLPECGCSLQSVFDMYLYTYNIRRTVF